jgi:hypothetical protein
VGNQTAPLAPNDSWTFSVGASPAPTTYALLIDEHQQALVINDVQLDLSRLPSSVARIVCVADWESTVPQSVSASLVNGLGPGGVSATPSSVRAASFELIIDQHQVQPATVFFELYRRRGAWKVRAIGQGYAGGRTELLADYGLPPTSLPATGEHQTAGLTLDADPLERMWMIFEDAARTTAAFTSAREYADVRLDDELSEAIANPATRHTEAAERSAAKAHSRRDELVAQARTNYERDASYLRTELQELDRLLPPSMASWASSSWRSATAGTSCGAIRLGEVLAPDIGDLRVPFCVKAPLRRPVWLSSNTSAAAEPVVAAMVLRLLAATPSPAPHLDVVDLSGGLRGVTDHLSGYMPRGVVTDHRNLAATIDAIAMALDVSALTAQAENQHPPAGIVVLSDFGFGLGHDALEPLSKLVSLIGDGRLSVVVVGEAPGDQSMVEPFVRELYSLSQVIPVGRDGIFMDPWTKGEWSFQADCLTPDIAQADWQPPLSVLAQLVTR